MENSRDKVSRSKGEERRCRAEAPSRRCRPHHGWAWLINRRVGYPGSRRLRSVRSSGFSCALLRDGSSAHWRRSAQGQFSSGNQWPSLAWCIANKRLFCIESELGAALRACQRQGNTLSSVLRAARDGWTLEPLIKTDRMPLDPQGTSAAVVRRRLQKADIDWNFCVDATAITAGTVSTPEAEVVSSEALGQGQW
jgi:hypothetical protein